MLVTLQTCIIAIITVILGFYAGKAHKKGNMKIFYSIVLIGILLYSFHVITTIGSARKEYLVEKEKIEMKYDKEIEELIRRYDNE